MMRTSMCCHLSSKARHCRPRLLWLPLLQCGLLCNLPSFCSNLQLSSPSVPPATALLLALDKHMHVSLAVHTPHPGDPTRSCAELGPGSSSLTAGALQPVQPPTPLRSCKLWVSSGSWSQSVEFEGGSALPSVVFSEIHLKKIHPLAKPALERHRKRVLASPPRPLPSPSFLLLRW